MTELMDTQPVIPVQGSALIRMLRYIHPHAKILIVAFALLILATGSDVLGPILIKTFIDRYLIPRQFPWRPVALLAGAYLVLQTATGILNFSQLLLFQKVALKVTISTAFSNLSTP